LIEVYFDFHWVTSSIYSLCLSSSGILLPNCDQGRSPVLFDDLPLLAKILIAVVGPPIMTIICWLVGPLLAGSRRERTRTRRWVEFWLMLLAAYLIFAIALAGILSFHGNDDVDLSSQLIR
jgi:hypothetical protein